MAGVESIQCPKCGSSLEVTSSTFQARCSYCGSMLRVSRDASGQPWAVLDDIREDTDILATDVVRKRLEERLVDLRTSRVALEVECAEIAAREANKGLSAFIWPEGHVALRRQQAALRKVREAHGPRMHALDADIAEAERQLRAATARMDGLISDAGGR